MGGIYILDVVRRERDYQRERLQHNIDDILVRENGGQGSCRPQSEVCFSCKGQLKDPFYKGKLNRPKP